MHSTDIQWSAILSWGYADNILRLKSKQSEPPINFIQCSQLHQVKCHCSLKISGASQQNSVLRRILLNKWSPKKQSYSSSRVIQVPKATWPPYVVGPEARLHVRAVDNIFRLKGQYVKNVLKSSTECEDIAASTLWCLFIVLQGS